MSEYINRNLMIKLRNNSLQLAQAKHEKVEIEERARIIAKKTILFAQDGVREYVIIESQKNDDNLERLKARAYCASLLVLTGVKDINYMHRRTAKVVLGCDFNVGAKFGGITYDKVVASLENISVFPHMLSNEINRKVWNPKVINPAHIDESSGFVRAYHDEHESEVIEHFTTWTARHEMPGTFRNRPR